MVVVVLLAAALVTLSLLVRGDARRCVGAAPLVGVLAVAAAAAAVGVVEGSGAAVTCAALVDDGLVALFLLLLGLRLVRLGWSGPVDEAPDESPGEATGPVLGGGLCGGGWLVVVVVGEVKD